MHNLRHGDCCFPKAVWLLRRTQQTSSVPYVSFIDKTVLQCDRMPSWRPCLSYHT
jgi:hypothetical protein